MISPGIAVSGLICYNEHIKFHVVEWFLLTIWIRAVLLAVSGNSTPVYERSVGREKVAIYRAFC